MQSIKSREVRGIVDEHKTLCKETYQRGSKL